MSNELLAMLIKIGLTEYYSLLWEQTQKIITKLILQYISNKKLPQDIETEDLLQCGYFVLCNAVQAFEYDKGYKLNTYFKFHVANVIGEELGYRTKAKQRFIQTSLQTHINTADSENLTLMDTMPDFEAEYNLINNVELTDLQRIVRQEVASLEQLQQQCIIMRYFQEYTVNQIAEGNSLTPDKVNTAISNAKLKLSKSKHMQALNNEFIEHYSLKTYPHLMYMPEYFDLVMKIEQRYKQGGYSSYGAKQKDIQLAQMKYKQALIKP